MIEPSAHIEENWRLPGASTWTHPGVSISPTNLRSFKSTTLTEVAGVMLATRMKRQSAVIVDESRLGTIRIRFGGISTSATKFRVFASKIETTSVRVPRHPRAYV